MAAWMKGVLALAGIGAVVVLAMTIGSTSDGDSMQTRSDAVVGDSPASDGSDPMQLPDGQAGREATELKAAEQAAFAADPGAPEGVGEDAEAAQAAPTPEVSLTGRFTDVNGRPIEGARVLFHAESGPVARFARSDDDHEEHERQRAPAPEVKTNSTGRFELTVDVPVEAERDEDLPDFLRSGSRLAVVHESFATLVLDTPNLAEGTMDLGTHVMDTGTQLAGRVVDEMGRAISGAKVTGHHVGSEPIGPGRMMRLFANRLAGSYSTVESGPDGRFFITGLPEGLAEVSATAEGRQMGVKSELELAVGSVQDIGDIVMDAGAVIAGYVSDEDGKPIEDARVNVSSMSRIVIRRMEDMPRQQIGHEMSLVARSDKDGYFELVGLGEGQYTVHVNADGFARKDTQNVATGVRDLQVVMSELGELIVRVKSASDDGPVSDAVIDARPMSDSPWGRIGGDGGPLSVVGPRDVGATGQPGEYRVSGAGPNGTELIVAADGFATLELEGPAVSSGGTQTMSVALVPESVIAGRVVGQDGQGVAEATVRIQEYVPPASDNGFGRFEIRREVRHTIGGSTESPMDQMTRAETDAEGYFEMRGVPAGDWELTAKAEEFVGSEPEVLTLTAGQSVSDVEVRLEIGGAVVGRVTEEDGTPVSGVRVLVKPQSAGRGQQGVEDALHGRLSAMLGEEQSDRATTAADGTFAVHSLAPGTYEVQIAKQGGMAFGRAMVFMSDGGSGSDDPDQVEIANVVAGEEVWIDLIQPPLSTLSGQVMAGGEPVEVALVSLKQAGSFLPFGGQTAETDRFGRYTFENVEPGEYEVSTVVQGAALPETVSVELEAGQGSEADIVFGGATVKGRVVDANTDEGAAGVTIVVTPIQRSSGGSGGSPQTRMSFQMITVDNSGGGGGMSMDIGGGSQSKVRTDANGEFEVRYLKAGQYSLETQGGGYTEGGSDTIDVSDGQSVDGVTIEVQRGAIISGTIVSGDTGDLLQGAPVSLISDNGREMTMAEGGRFNFEGLDAGEYTIQVMGSGFGGAPIASEVVVVDAGEARMVDLTTDT